MHRDLGSADAGANKKYQRAGACQPLDLYGLVRCWCCITNDSFYVCYDTKYPIIHIFSAMLCVLGSLFAGAGLFLTLH